MFIQVSSDWRIRQKLVGLSTLRKSPDHQTLTAAMEKHYVEELKPDLTKLIAAMVDRASTNKAALDLLASEHGGLAFLRAYCNSHTLCHVGGNFESKELDSFFSAYRFWFIDFHASASTRDRYGGRCGGSTTRWRARWVPR